MPDTKKVLVDRHGAVAVVTINNAKSHNALSKQVMKELINAMSALANDGDVRAIVLTGAGDKAFCVGLDLKELNDAQAIDMGVEGARSLGVDAPLVKAFSDTPQAIIAAVNGFAVTGGFELALGCDFIVCAESAQFADTHALVGLLPGWGLSQKLARLIGLNRAKEISFTGRYVSADEAHRLGFVNHIYPSESLLEEAIAIAEKIAISDKNALEKIKQMMDDGARLPLGEGLIMEGDAAQDYNDALDFSYLQERLQTLRTLAKTSAKK